MQRYSNIVALHLLICVKCWIILPLQMQLKLAFAVNAEKEQNQEGGGGNSNANALSQYTYAHAHVNTQVHSNDENDATSTTTHSDQTGGMQQDIQMARNERIALHVVPTPLLTCIDNDAWAYSLPSQDDNDDDDDDDASISIPCERIHNDQSLLVDLCPIVEVHTNCPVSCGVCCQDDPEFTFQLNVQASSGRGRGRERERGVEGVQVLEREGESRGEDSFALASISCDHDFDWKHIPHWCNFITRDGVKVAHRCPQRCNYCQSESYVVNTNTGIYTRTHANSFASTSASASESESESAQESLNGSPSNHVKRIMMAITSNTVSSGGVQSTSPTTKQSESSPSTSSEKRTSGKLTMTTTQTLSPTDDHPNVHARKISTKLPTYTSRPTAIATVRRITSKPSEMKSEHLLSGPHMNMSSISPTTIRTTRPSIQTRPYKVSSKSPSSSSSSTSLPISEITSKPSEIISKLPSKLPSVVPSMTRTLPPSVQISVPVHVVPNSPTTVVSPSTHPSVRDVVSSSSKSPSSSSSAVAVIKNTFKPSGMMSDLPSDRPSKMSTMIRTLSPSAHPTMPVEPTSMPRSITTRTTKPSKSEYEYISETTLSPSSKMKSIMPNMTPTTISSRPTENVRVSLSPSESPTCKSRSLSPTMLVTNNPTQSIEKPSFTPSMHPFPIPPTAPTHTNESLPTIKPLSQSRSPHIDPTLAPRISPTMSPQKEHAPPPSNHSSPLSTITSMPTKGTEPSNPSMPSVSPMKNIMETPNRSKAPNNKPSSSPTPAIGNSWRFLVVADIHSFTPFSFNHLEKNKHTALWNNLYRVLTHVKDNYGGELAILPGDMVSYGFLGEVQDYIDRLGGDNHLSPEEAVYIATRNAHYTTRMLFEEVGYETVLATIGDHEIGNNDGFVKLGEKKSKLSTLYSHRRGFGDGFNRNDDDKQEFRFDRVLFDNIPSRPIGTAYENTTFAYVHRNSLFVTVDAFELVGNGTQNYIDKKNGLGGEGAVACTVSGDHLAWFESILSYGRNSLAIKHIFVQAHPPIVQPVRKVKCSGQFFDASEQSAFWELMNEYRVDIYFAGEVHSNTAIKASYSNSSLVQVVSRGRAINNFLTVDVSENAIDVKIYNEYGDRSKFNAQYKESGNLMVDKSSGGAEMTSGGMLQLLDVMSEIIFFQFEEIFPLGTRQVLAMRSDTSLVATEVTIRNKLCKDSIPNRGGFGAQYDAQVCNVTLVEGRNQGGFAGVFNEDSRFGIYGTGPLGGGEIVSFGIWIKTTEASSRMVLVHYANYWGSFVPNDHLKDHFTLALDNGVPTVNLQPIIQWKPSLEMNLADGAWHHVAVSMPRKSCKASELDIYIDGKRINHFQVSEDRFIFYTTTGRLSLGGFGYSNIGFEDAYPGMGPYIGAMDDFKLYARPLKMSTDFPSQFHLVP